MSGFRYKKSQEELHEAFLRQVGHLRRSIDAYDKGDVEEAERLATSVYTLFFDGGSNSKSAAKLAGVKDKLKFPDSRFTSPTEPGKIWLGPPLCIIGLAGCYWPRNHHLPNEEEAAETAGYPRVAFSKWWKQVVYTTDRGLELSRMNLVFALRHQDGGSHVDKTLRDEAYHWLAAYGEICLGIAPHHDEYEAQFIVYCGNAARRHGRQWSITTRAYLEAGTPIIATSTEPPPPDATPIRYAHWASMRQIAWEANLALIEAGF